MIDEQIVEAVDEVAAEKAPKTPKAKRAPVLDLSQPYATVHGSPGRGYLQDGQYFDGKGNLTTAPE